MPTDLSARRDLVWRAALPLAALVVLATPAPAPVSGVLAIVAIALSAERLTRLRSTGTADRVLVGVGGVVVVVVLLGMLMGSTPIGLRAQTWVVGLAVTSLVGLVVAALLPAREPLPVHDGPVLAPGGPGRTALRLTPWIAVSVLVLGVAIQLSATSLERADEPPLQLSLGRVSGTRVQVVTSTTDAIGPLELRTSADGNDVSYPLLTLGAGDSATTTLVLPTTGRYTITLNYPDQTKPLRTLVLDR